ncbi:uncharacterized protein SOCE836_064450 [Sorangium cellulosum]|uniref:Secreted protein n=2 Tax=Polyangiaceae TaxID=49 RepID=A0A4P2QV34_SORCE|nr:uncharacterized protein SOCE836_064450 [Sorangium cellulosum]WCQ93592.1 hypothetical protein NQZ70_06344 [Sorangium sp. Soce836]
MPSFSILRGSLLHAFMASAFLVACSGGDGGSGGAGGEETGGGGAGGEETGGGGAGGEETGGGGGAGGEESCDAMRDDEALDEPISIVVTNERSTPVYYSVSEFGSIDWWIDGTNLFGSKLPTCEGLLMGEPGGPLVGPVFEEIAPGASVTIDWHGRLAESASVVAGCLSPSLEEEYETCDRFELVGDGAHELKITVFLERDEETGIASSPLPAITVPFTLPTESIAVTIPEDP